MNSEHVKPDSEFREANSIVHSTVQLGDKVIVWHWSQLREDVTVGSASSIGQGVYVGPGVTIGRNCKVQNGAQIYEPAVIHDGVFIGPNAVLTNDKKPRAVTHGTGAMKSVDDWEKVGVQINTGASLGANVVCVAPVVVGEWAMIGAGTVVTKDVKPYALFAGNPGRQIGWVGRGGSKLIQSSNGFQCPDTGDRYELSPGEFLLRLSGSPKA